MKTRQMFYVSVKGKTIFHVDVKARQIFPFCFKSRQIFPYCYKCHGKFRLFHVDIKTIKARINFPCWEKSQAIFPCWYKNCGICSWDPKCTILTQSFLVLKGFFAGAEFLFLTSSAYFLSN